MRRRRWQRQEIEGGIDWDKGVRAARKRWQSIGGARRVAPLVPTLPLPLLRRGRACEVEIADRLPDSDAQERMSSADLATAESIMARVEAAK